MSDTTDTRSGNTGLAFIVGALVVAVGVLGWFVFGQTDVGNDLNISIEGADTPVESAAEAVSGN